MPNDDPRRKRLWVAIERKRLSVEDTQTRRIHDALQDSINPVLERLRSQGPQDAIDDIESEINQQAIQQGYIDLYQSVGVSFAWDTFEGLTMQKQEDETLEDIWMQRLKEFVVLEAKERIEGVITFSVEEVKKVLEEGIQEGYGIEKIARNIQSSNGMSRVRARRIARTEIVSASNEGSMVGARATSLNLQKEWLSTQDGRTRTFVDSNWSHVQADGETVGMDEMFEDTGEPLKYPGDPSGSAGNVINCRCTVVHKTYD